jgi:hypothetical protein
MASSMRSDFFSGFLSRWVCWSAVVLGSLALVSLVPDLWWLAPWPAHDNPVASALLLAVVSVAFWRRSSLGKSGTSATKITPVLSWIDHIAAGTLARGLPIVVATLLVTTLLLWAPAYLSRPWFRDIDTFANLARAWDTGQAPYRDIRAYNFPGHIYVCWVSGKLFGWGQTAPFFAVDLALLSALCVSVTAWSLRRLGSPIPGLVASASIICYYMNSNYMMIAQRDWQAASLLVLAMLALDSLRGPGGLILAALLTALAGTLRPHAVLFLPALVSVLFTYQEKSGSHNFAVRRFAIWLACTAFFAVAAFAPLIVQGLLPSLIQGLRAVSYGSRYASSNPLSFSSLIAADLSSGVTSPVLLGLCLLACFGPRSLQSHARSFGLALCGAILWRAAHPSPHFYLTLPRNLLTCVGLAILTAAALEIRWLRAFEKLLITVILLVVAVPGLPSTLSLAGSQQGLLALLANDVPTAMPLGCEVGFGREGVGLAYSWSDYRATLRYLRSETIPEAPVANLLRQFPFPPVNGPSGHPDLFKREAGICWTLMLGEDLDAEYAENLRSASKALVVWSPGEQPDQRLALPLSQAVIHAFYKLNVRFGTIEVWSRVEDEQ